MNDNSNPVTLKNPAIGGGLTYFDLLRMSKAAFRRSFSLCDQLVDPDDIQDCVSKLWEEIPYFRQDIGNGKGSIRGYIGQRAKFFAKNRRRAIIREQNRMSRIGAMEDNGVNIPAKPTKQLPEFSAEDITSNECLTFEQRDIAERYFIHKQSCRAIGEHMGCSHETARKEIHKIVRTLREKLNPES